jgi:hypothetical protein
MEWKLLMEHVVGEELKRRVPPPSRFSLCPFSAYGLAYKVSEYSTRGEPIILAT